MLRVTPARLLSRAVPVLPVALLVFYGCSDAPSLVEPRVAARAHALAGPTVIVTNTNDAGPGSLRQAILDAATGTTIQFDPSIAGQTIVLSTGQLQVDKMLTIEGPLPAGMTISGGHVDRVMSIVTGGGDVVLRNLSIVNGRQNAVGGGIFLSGKLLLDHSLVANNELTNGPIRPFGGGIWVGGDLTVVNSTVSGNVAPSGGGIFVEFGTLTTHNSTIAGNIAQTGGGLAAYVGSVNLHNTIIANNIEQSGSSNPEHNCSLGLSIVYSGTNMSNDDTCGSGPAMVVASPLPLGALAGNGGPTWTHALPIGSPAIDAGTNCTESTDQRYVARNQGASCDIGAFELDAFGTVAVTVGPNVAVDEKTGLATVTGTIKCSAPVDMTLDVAMSQTQKTTGKFATIIQGSSTTSIACTGTLSSWSAVVAPLTGAFQSGSATTVAKTTTLPNGFTPATVTTSVKLFKAK